MLQENNTVKTIALINALVGTGKNGPNESKAPVITDDVAKSFVVSFSDGADGMPLASCVVQIDPVRSGSGDPAPDNVKPITGWTGVNVYRTGRNLFDKNSPDNVLNKYLRTSDGGLINSTSGYDTSGYISAKPGQVYTASGFTTTGVSEVCFYDSEKAFISGVASANHTFTAPERTAYIRFDYKHADLDAMQLEVGSTASAYQPYTGTTYPISWQTAAGTVYGGTLDTVSGTLTVDRVFVEIDGTNKAVVFHKTGAAATAFRYGIVESADYADGTKDQISNYLHKASQDQTANGKLEYAVYANNGTIYLTLPLEIEDADDANAYLAQHNLQVVYYLVTPRTIQLDPVQITTLLGENHIWADTGAISLTYPADTKLYVQKELAISQSLMELIITANHESGMTASKAYSAGDLLVVNGTLYKATTSIANGGTLTVGTNVTATTVANELAALA